MKVKLFTDFDLDGIGCGILAKKAFKDIDITYCNGHDPNEYLDKFIINKDYELYDKIYITDLSPNETNARILDNLCSDKILLFDHHKTAKWITKYNWAYVSDDSVNSGTSLFYSYLLTSSIIKNTILLDELVELIRLYDTWEWSRLKIENPRKLNDLCMILGRNIFIEYILEKIKNNDNTILNNNDFIIIKAREEQCKEYIQLQNRNLIPKKFQNYTIGCIISERYEFVSMVGNELAKIYTELDFIMIINPLSGTVNLRGIKDDINLGEIAKLFGGGGHPKAAGFKFNKDKVTKIISDLMLD